MRARAAVKGLGLTRGPDHIRSDAFAFLVYLEDARTRRAQVLGVSREAEEGVLRHGGVLGHAAYAHEAALSLAQHGGEELVERVVGVAHHEEPLRARLEG